MANEKPTEKVVPVTDGPDHGYIGQVQDDTPNEDYTVTGVTKAAEAASRESAAEQPAKPSPRRSAAKS